MHVFSRFISLYHSHFSFTLNNSIIKEKSIMDYYKKLEQLHSKTKSKMAMYNDNHYTIDGKTYTLDGENIDHLYQSNLKAKFKPSQIEGYQSLETLGEHEKDNGGFVFVFYQISTITQDLFPNLNKQDIARLLYLITYINYNDGRIVYDNGRVIDDKTLSKMLKLQPRQYKTYIKKLKDNNLLHIDNDNEKYITDVIAKRGSINTKLLSKNNISYIRMFRDTVRELFDNASNRDIGRLSVIYSILPYLNLSTNIVCHNPYETDKDKINSMTIAELTERLGYKDANKFRQTLYSLKIDNQNVFGFFLQDGDKRAMKIVVNPRVVCACNAEQLAAIMVLFKRNDT